MSGLTLAQRVLAIAGALHDVPHAFGGAIALAYHAEPRATIDIDLNVFVPTSESASVLGPLDELGADVDGLGSLIERDGQARARWDGTPIDLFFADDPFHAAAQKAAIEVPFAHERIRVLAVEHLIVCKVVFDRGRDWVDIDAIVAQGTFVDLAEVLRWVGRVLGDDDPRYDRIASVLAARS